MNLRQKCKKQKQYIEKLEKMALPTRTLFYTSETLRHLRIRREIVIDWGYSLEDREEYFKDLTLNQIAHDIGIVLMDSVVFDDKEGIATLDVWVERKG